MKRKVRTKQEKMNRNAAIGQFSNYLLATSLALTGTALIEFFTKEPQFSKLESALFIVTGYAVLWFSCFVNYLKEDPDHDDSQ